MELWNIPSSWEWTTLGKISKINMGQSPPSITYNDEGKGLPFYQGKSDFGELNPKPRTWCSKPQKIANKNDILITVRAPVGPTNLANEKCCIGRGLAAISSLNEIPPLLMLYYLRFVEKEIAAMGSGSTFTSINRSDLELIQFPLPPSNEQKRIVSKIEDLFKESKSAREALDKMPEIMKRFRQSVLAKAFRGELVPQDPNDEPAEKTLEKLRIEKREKLKKEPIAKGRKNKQIEYEESEPLDIEKLSELPVGWTLSRLGEITNIIGGGTPKREVRSYYDNGKIPWVTPTDIDPKKILPISKTAIYITNRGLRESSARLFPKGTVLFSSRASIGKIAIADTEMSSNQGFANIIPDKILDSEYLAYGLRNFVREIESLGSGTTFLEVAKSSLKQFPFPLAPLGEQKRIVKRIKELFSFADQIEKSVEEAKKRIDKIDQAILAKAFRGELVPQDPNDEPASVLLERITKKKELEKPVKKDKKICKD